MKQFRSAVLVAGFILICQVDCSAFFEWPLEVREAYEKAQAVFIGEVTAIKKPKSSAPTASFSDRLYQVTFKVEYSWKGAGFQELGARELIVWSDQGTDNDMCDWCFCLLLRWGSFSEGTKYLVFAEETAGKDLLVPVASRTTPLFKASEELKELQRMSHPFYRLRAKR